MNFGIDAHLLSFIPGYRRAGVSQYTEQIVRRLAQIVPESEDRLTVYVGRTAPQDGYVPSPAGWQRSILPTERAPFRIAWEQAIAPIATKRAGLDTLLCPVNVVPLAGIVPSVVTVHDLAFVKLPEMFVPAKRRYLSVMTRLSVHRARQVIAVSAQTKADIVALFGVAPEKITVIPNATDARFAPAAPGADLAAFRAIHGLPERYILFVGTVEPRKNLKRLLAAFAQLTEHESNIGLAVVGASGWLNSDIAPLVLTLELEGRVTFAGYVPDDDLPLWYQAATVFCYPSLYEGFGLPVLEAMACGTPVITSDIGSMTEIGHDAAMLVEPTDTDAIAAALRQMLDDPALRAARSRAGLLRAGQYSWDRTAAETLVVLRRAAKR